MAMEKFSFDNRLKWQDKNTQLDIFEYIVLSPILFSLEPSMSYFEPAVQASMGKEVLGNIHRGHEHTLLKSNITAESTFKHFDANIDRKLDEREFANLLGDLFCDTSGKPHYIDAAKFDEMFKNNGIMEDITDTSEMPEQTTAVIPKSQIPQANM